MELGRMSQEEQTSRMAVLLFTDMVESVALERRLGTEAYSRLLRRHHQLFQEVLTKLGAGKIHLDTGDGFLSEFTTSADAVNAALLFQASLSQEKWETEAPKVRIGLHQGQLAEIRVDPDSPGKVVGISVSIASRVMGVAQPGQILMSRPVYDDARQFVREHPIARFSPPSPAPALQWKSHGSYLFKGADAPMELFEVGAFGTLPLTSPPDSDKARRLEPTQEPKEDHPRPRFLRPATGAALTALCGLMLFTMPFGERWTHASYDYLCRFGSRTVTNKVVLVLMDNEARDKLQQPREQRWDRSIHAKLLNRLADEGCPLVVLDAFFRQSGEGASDQSLIAALRRLQHVVLMAEQAGAAHPGLAAARPIFPTEALLAAAGTNWGVAWYDADLDLVVRRHWPFPSPGPYPSLPWTAARLAGANLSDVPKERWLRYYGANGAWANLSYHLAFQETSNYFHDKVVFIGNKPATTLPDGEKDKFRTPFTSWTGETASGVELHATAFLNLVNSDWLQRPPWAMELVLILLAGAGFGATLCRFRPLIAVGVAVASVLIVGIGAVLLSYFTGFWFPWLVVAGGQVPCALAWALSPAPARPKARPSPARTVVLTSPGEKLPDAPEYELFNPPFGEGGFGKVWLARNAIGQWQALKAIYLAKFGDNPGPYEAEFKGLQKYKPVSEKHPGLLRIDLVSRKKEAGYFYYVMELGDSRTPGWEQNPATYKPKDLESLRKQADGRQLPFAECVRIGTILADALDFLHRQGLTHRDIKPSNVIFVNGRPKLADVGLVTDIRPPELVHTWVGTAGYMPPPPERPGTAQADIYALGMVLYVISTGRDPELFPALSTTLMERSAHADYIRLNAIILKACQPDCTQRYQTTGGMLQALQELQPAVN
jgi:CHASE2 domain-containing sensor protein/class 3 adenylate cyclase